MEFPACPKCGKPDSSPNGFDPCEECKQKEQDEKEQRRFEQERLQLLEVSDDDRG